jgi:hypothetical protein
MISMGTTGTLKAVLNVKCDKAQPLPNEIMTPVNAAIAPSRKYSRAVMMRIWRLVPPNVRSNTLSLIRWYLLSNTEATNTTSPVIILNAAIKRITNPILSRISSSTLSISPTSIMDIFGKDVTTAC